MQSPLHSKSSPPKLHILGIAGTFMGGVAQLAKALGFQVTGSDHAVYPPMSDQLAQAHIEVKPETADPLVGQPDQVMIGNALSRGHPAVERVLNAKQAYISGPQWLSQHLLQNRWVVAVAGTHGKTTTASMVAWILECAGLEPGFLIGGVPENFGVSARLGRSPFFVIEADEYDTAFFDKRSKFLHYLPNTCVINNLEFDHGDIFSDLSAIQTQFHHWVRTVPANGQIIAPLQVPAIQQVLERGCWTPVSDLVGQTPSAAPPQMTPTPEMAAQWQYRPLTQDGSQFEVLKDGEVQGQVRWSLSCEHNMQNALAAIAAAHHCGVAVDGALEALCHFKGVRRRLTECGVVDGVRILDDFAHHPSAIALTLAGLRAQLSKSGERLLVVFEPRSNTMRLGMHQTRLPQAFAQADAVFAFVDPAWGWALATESFVCPVAVHESYDTLLEAVAAAVLPGDTVVFMSNGHFGDLPNRLLQALKDKEQSMRRV